MIIIKKNLINESAKSCVKMQLPALVQVILNLAKDGKAVFRDIQILLTLTPGNFLNISGNFKLARVTNYEFSLKKSGDDDFFFYAVG